MQRQNTWQNSSPKHWIELGKLAPLSRKAIRPAPLDAKRSASSGRDWETFSSREE
jgi:hypothetical protein